MRGCQEVVKLREVVSVETVAFPLPKVRAASKDSVRRVRLRGEILTRSWMTSTSVGRDWRLGVESVRRTSLFRRMRR